MSTHNYGIRKGCSIDSSLLEKILIFDLAKKTEEPCAFAMSNLEACCDRQLPNVGGIVEESVEANREAIKLITKVLPRCKYFVGTNCGISEDSHGGMNTLLGGIGQRNVFSDNVCRDFYVLCLKK